VPAMVLQRRRLSGALAGASCPATMRALPVWVCAPPAEQALTVAEQCFCAGMAARAVAAAGPVAQPLKTMT